jgi:hypothetical protein
MRKKGEDERGGRGGEVGRRREVGKGERSMGRGTQRIKYGDEGRRGKEN